MTFAQILSRCVKHHRSQMHERNLTHLIKSLMSIQDYNLKRNKVQYNGSFSSSASMISTPADKIDIIPYEYPSVQKFPKVEFDKNGSIVSSSFVQMLRDSAPYVDAHRGKVMVVHVSSKLMKVRTYDGKVIWNSVLDDISLMWLLGVKVVLVLDCRSHVNEKIRGACSSSEEDYLPLSKDPKPIDSELLRIIKEEVGFVRFEAERCLAKSLQRFSRTASAASGHLYLASPVGVINGKDFKHAGNIRSVDKEKVSRIHDSNDIAIVSPLGISPSGEFYFVNSHEIANRFAASLQASKVIFCLENSSHLLFQTSRGSELLQSLQYPDAKNLLAKYENYTDLEDDVSETLLAMSESMAPLEAGVKRAHLVNPIDGALLQELYSVS